MKPLPLPLDTNDEDLTAWVVEWMRLLELGDFVQAFKSVSHEACYEWTPELMANVISNYGRVETELGKHRIAFPSDLADQGSPRARVEWFNETQTNGELWYDAPLDGKWSDLTFTFAVKRKVTGVDIVLNEIHVM